MLLSVIKWFMAGKISNFFFYGNSFVESKPIRLQ